MSQSAPPRNPIEEVAEFFARGPSLSEISRFELSSSTQAWISELLDKEDDGLLTAEERHQLDELLMVHDLITLIRSRVPPTTEPSSASQQA